MSKETPLAIELQYLDGYALVQQKKADLPARSLVVMHIAEVFECRPGADAGKKLI